MKVWVKILNGRVRHKFETPDNFVPKFGPPITAVDVTDLVPQPEEHWFYDLETDKFTPGLRPKLPVDQDSLDAQALSEITGVFTATQTASALRLLLRKAYSLEG